MTIVPPILPKDCRLPERSPSVRRGMQVVNVAARKRSLNVDEEFEMKRCPTCRRLFAAGLKFCRFDGTQLVSETMPLGDAPTILFSTTQISERFPWLVVDSQSSGPERIVTEEIVTGPITKSHRS